MSVHSAMEKISGGGKNKRSTLNAPWSKSYPESKSDATWVPLLNAFKVNFILPSSAWVKHFLSGIVVARTVIFGPSFEVKTSTVLFAEQLHKRLFRKSLKLQSAILPLAFQTPLRVEAGQVTSVYL